MSKPIYMDHHATTPVLPEVFEAMVPFLTEHFGNASSTTHVYGRVAADAVEKARHQVAKFLGASPAEIVFTAGATESNNLAIRGIAQAAGKRGGRIVTCAVEHEAILETCHAMQEEGFEVTVLPVDRHGMVGVEQAARAIDEGTILVTIQTANNEMGTIQPIAELARIAHDRGAAFHTDAAQAAGRLPLGLTDLGVDLASFSAHKMYGPKGIGALYVRRGSKLRAQLTGGGHEKKRRSGTLNVPGIVGFGAAAAAAARDFEAETGRQRALRDRLWERLSGSVEEIVLNGHPDRRLPNNLSVCFRHVEGEALLVALRDVAALSAGSACHSGTVQGSYVLRAMGVAEEDAHGALRFGLGRSNTEAEVDLVAERVAAAVARLRALSPSHAAGRARSRGAPEGAGRG